ncbi:MAG: asparagine synthase (glutamine-hydrolyzing) [Rickettsiales bacterium]|nr:asparagine synthase (glutamine-hydrolyzing) [Rickettsiales bacterium]
MCGILGGIVVKNKNDQLQEFKQALQYLEHRGPDDSGCIEIDRVDKSTVIFGQTRLSILDLSKAGHQPMTTSDGSMTIAYNGEVYNYKELREELSTLGYQFTTETDTEVLLNAFHCWGKDCLIKCKGMFAFAIYDKNQNQLHLCRDAFGIKPLFYSYNNGELYFASEIKPLLKLKASIPSIDLQTSYDYLVHGVYGHNANTFFKEIKQLPPANSITFNLQFLTLEAPEVWWFPKGDLDNAMSFEDAAKKLKDLFIESVKLHLRSDVPIGAALSGGLDSSAIVCAIRHLLPEKELKTFSYIAKGEEKSEEKWVDLVNDYTRATPHKVTANPEKLLEELDRLIRLQEEPFGSTSIYAQYKVFEEVKKQGIKVTLDGQGADELLAGYSGYPGFRLLSLVEEKRHFDAVKFVKLWSKQPGRSKLFAIGELLRIKLPTAIYKLLWRIKGRPFKPKWLKLALLKKQGVDFNEPVTKPLKALKRRRVIEKLISSLSFRGLPKLLRHGDRNSMAFSIESRVPFLTTEMAEFLYSLPESYLISEQGDTKHIFREAMKGIVPEEILNRKDKIGFDAGSESWKKHYIEKLSNLEYGDEEPFNKKQLFEILPSLSEQQIWRILNYKIFYDNFLGE